jgi:hypothetical protein
VGNNAGCQGIGQSSAYCNALLLLDVWQSKKVFWRAFNSGKKKLHGFGSLSQLLKRGALTNQALSQAIGVQKLTFCQKS